MTFLAPTLLALGAAVAVPLLLHLLHRHRAPRVTFPAVRYLRRAEREHAVRIRVRQLLLLALRAAGILFLAGAAARPFLEAERGAHTPTAVTIVLDNSMSSGAVVDDRRILDDLKAAARRTLDAAGRDDTFWLIRAGAPWEPAVRGSADELRRAVDETAPTDASGDIGAALARARGLLIGSGQDTREIHLLSDLQVGALAGAPLEDSLGADAGAVPVRLLAPPRPAPPNQAVIDIQVGGGLPPRAGQRSTVSAVLAVSPGAMAPERVDGGSGPEGASDPGGGSEPAEPAGSGAPRGTASYGDSVNVRLVLDGSVRALSRVAAGESVVLPFPGRDAGLVTGHVEIDRDALAADDRRRFVVRVAPAPSVALAAPAPFIEEAIDVLAEAGRVRRAGPGSADVVIAPAGAGVRAVERGAGVIVVPPTTRLQQAAINRRLVEAGIPWRLDGLTTDGQQIDTAGLALARTLADVRLRHVYALGPRRVGKPGTDSVLLRLSTGEPWAVAGRVGSDADRGSGAGRYVLLATPMTAGAGSVPTSAAMIPLLDHAINVWLTRDRTVPGHEPGDRVTFPGADSVVAPTGETRVLQPGGGHRLTEAGIYYLTTGDDTVAAVASNSPASESDLRRLTTEEAARRIPGDVRVAGPGEWVDVIYHRRLGRELTVALIAMALAVLVLESAVAAAGRAA